MDDPDDPKTPPDTPPRAAKKAKYLQKYAKHWESLPTFKGWLQPSAKSDSRAYCKACDCELNAKKSELEKHAQGQKHKSSIRSVSKQPTLMSLPSVSNPMRGKNVKEGEIKLAAFVVEHNLPLNIMTHLPELIRSVCKDSDIAKKIASSRTKTTAVIKNVLGKSSREELVDILREKKFSLIVDESTDKGCTKHLCVIARTMIKTKVTDAFYDLIPLENASAQSLYETVVKCLADEGIPYKDNMIGFASDGASVMMGAHNSLASRLKSDIPDLFVMKCICHSFHLCASYACATLPRVVEQLARDVYNYFMSSPKRLSELKEFQEFVKVKPHKLLHPSQTRWLSLQAVVSRLLEQYDALQLYFTSAALSDRILAAESILDKLKDPANKLYLQFLEFILPLFNDLNKKMQSQGPQIHTMYESVSTVCKTIMDCYIRGDYMRRTAIENVQYRNPSNFVPLHKIYLGAKVSAAVENNTHGLSKSDLEAFQKRCLGFLIESVNQIYMRFPFKSLVLKNISFIHPRVVMNRNITSIAPLASLVPGIIGPDKLNEVDREWRVLRNTELNVPDSTDVEEFWCTIKEMKSGDDTPMFPHLSQLVSGLLCLPHSSASAERIFSAVNNLKTKQRNRLSTKTLVGFLHSKRYLEDTRCGTFSVEDKLISKMNLGMYERDASDSD